MEQNIKLYLPLDFKQILELVKQLPGNQRQQLVRFLQKDDRTSNDPTLTHLASQDVLAKDWLTPEEDNAWQDL